MINIAINGFGRIGKNIVRALANGYAKDINLVAINGTSEIDKIAHFFKYDSILGNFSGKVSYDADNYLYINDKKIKICQERDPSNLNWGGLDVDIVLECSGKFNKKTDALKHVKNKVKKVIVSAPCKDADKTIVYGVNHHVLSKDDVIISAGSCTTNCLAPIAKVVNDNIGIVNGFMTTIHAYTNDQRILDGSHKDLRRARACAVSMIPTSTGAAKAIGEVIPELDGKLQGNAVRVPTANVSFVDFTFIMKEVCSAEMLNDLFIKAENGSLKNVLATCNEPLVSVDFNSNPHSSIIDLELTRVNNTLGKICAWYDNEWAFSLRMLDIAQLLKNLS